MDIVLRPWNRRDADALWRAAATSSDLSAQLGDADLSTSAASADFIDRNLAPASPQAQHLAIVVDGAAVGNVGLSNIDRRHDTAWVFYWVAAGSRGHGLASTCLATLAQWAHRDLGLFRLELGHRVNNPASCAVARHAGFLVEGLERQKLRYGDQRYDVETHARLATDPAPTLGASAIGGVPHRVTLTAPQ